jgi:hypothetical protein
MKGKPNSAAAAARSPAFSTPRKSATGTPAAAKNCFCRSLSYIYEPFAMLAAVRCQRQLPGFTGLNGPHARLIGSGPREVQTGYEALTLLAHRHSSCTACTWTEPSTAGGAQSEVDVPQVLCSLLTPAPPHPRKDHLDDCEGAAAGVHTAAAPRLQLR